jgi:hypothetical protein
VVDQNCPIYWDSWNNQEKVFDLIGPNLFQRSAS